MRIMLYSKRDFNPRSREGMDINEIYWFPITRISIHAPARGATFFRFSRFKHLEHFNPRSREGSDCDCTFSWTQVYIFQSTLPRGERPILRYLVTRFFDISIHAPAGATKTEMISYVELYNFNPRSREGSDIASAIHAGTKETFQSTLPRGERRPGRNRSCSR